MSYIDGIYFVENNITLLNNTGSYCTIDTKKDGDVYGDTSLLVDFIKEVTSLPPEVLNKYFPSLFIKKD